MKKITLVIIFCSFLFCCNIQSEKDVSIFKSFPIENKVSLSKFLYFKYGVPKKLYLQDTTIFIKNSNGATDYYFYQYSLNNKSMLSRYFKGGRGIGQALGPLSSGILGSSIWIHDITLEKISIVPISKNIAAYDTLDIQEYKMPSFYYSLQLINKNKFIGSGSDNSPFKIQNVDLESRKVIYEFGEFQNIPNNVPLYAWKMAYDSFLFYKPSGNKVALTCRLADQIEILDLKSKKSKMIKGPENFKAEFKYGKVDGMDVSIRNEKSRYAFVGGTCTNDYIYLLYSGNLHTSKYNDYGKYIYVYDWNGNPIKKLILNQYVSDICVTNDNSQLYASEASQSFVLNANIKVND